MPQSIKEKIKARQEKNAGQILDNLVKSFENPQFLQDAVIKTFLDPLDAPQNAYSRMNRILLAIQGSYDARGNAAWRKLNKFPMNWSKQVFIMMPKTIKIHDKENEEEKTITTGFFFKGLYDVENTYGGSKVEYVKNAPKELPPLHDVAEKWNIKIEYKVDPRGYGCYIPAKNTIQLGTANKCTFWHELAHAAHKKIDGQLKAGQDPQQEAIAQLSAGVLAQMYGEKMDLYTYEYIKHYAKDDPKKAMQLISKVLNKTGQVLELILETTNYKILEAQVN